MAKIERQTNAAGEKFRKDEEYISAIDGNSLILTIDYDNTINCRKIFRRSVYR